MQRGTDAQRNMIKLAIETGELSQLSIILEAVRDTGALAASRQAAASEAARAIKALDQLKPSQYRDALLQLASQLLVRHA